MSRFADKPQDLKPTINDPKIWIIECKGGNERDIATQIMAHAKESGLLIISTIALDHLKSYIYVEAYKESEVRKACSGIPEINKKSKIRLVPLNERPDALSVKNSPHLSKDKVEFFLKGERVSVVEGPYKGSKGSVDKVEEDTIHVRLKSAPFRVVVLKHNEVHKFYEPGSHVIVISGPSAGVSGLVISHEENVVLMISDKTKIQLSVAAADVLESSFVPATQSWSSKHSKKQRIHGPEMDKSPRSTNQIIIETEKSPRSTNQIIIETENPRKTKPCARYQMGKCSLGQNCKYVHVERQNSHFDRGEPAASSMNMLCWKTRLCFQWENKGRCWNGTNCNFAHGEKELRPLSDVKHEDISNSGTKSSSAALRGRHEIIYNSGTKSSSADPHGPYHEIRGQSGVQNKVVPNSRLQSAAAGSSGPYRGPANVPARDQIFSNFRPESATADPRGANRRHTNVPARVQIVSNFRPESATADPRGLYHGPANVPAPDQDGER